MVPRTLQTRAHEWLAPHVLHPWGSGAQRRPRFHAHTLLSWQERRGLWMKRGSVRGPALTHEALSREPRHSLRKEDGALGRGFRPGDWPQPPTKALCGTCRSQACSGGPAPSLRRNESRGSLGPSTFRRPCASFITSRCQGRGHIRVSLLILSLWHPWIFCGGSV